MQTIFDDLSMGTEKPYTLFINDTEITKNFADAIGKQFPVTSESIKTNMIEKRAFTDPNVALQWLLDLNLIPTCGDCVPDEIFNKFNINHFEYTRSYSNRHEKNQINIKKGLDGSIICEVQFVVQYVLDNNIENPRLLFLIPSTLTITPGKTENDGQLGPCECTVTTDCRKIKQIPFSPPE